jgi:hypothetical protein
VTSLAEWLRARTDEQLTELLRRRPDLSLPAPADLAALASRLSVRTSVQRAIDALDAFDLRILEAVVLAADEDGRARAVDVQALAPLAEIGRAIVDLLTLGLLWGDEEIVHLAPTVREAIGPYPAGLGRPAALLFAAVPEVRLAPVLQSLGLPPAIQPNAGAAVAAVLADPARVLDLTRASDPAELEILDNLAVGPPIGRVRQPQVLPAGEPPTPPQRLVARGLLVQIDSQTVELPREVGLALRGEQSITVQTDPVPIPTITRTPAELDRLGTTAVLDVLRQIETLGESWSANPPTQLRAGGVGVRDLRRTARDLGCDEPTAALLAETAQAADLIGTTSGPEPVFLPTPEFDAWRRDPPARRWTAIASAWLAMTRQPNLVNQRGDRERLITVLSPDAERGMIPALRTTVLTTIGGLPPGSAPESRDAVLARLSWQAPRRAGAQRPAAEAILAEADILGITAAGGLTGYSRTLLDGSRTVAEQVLETALPQPVDYVLVQPDLTVVVPGPPLPALATELALTADLESSGGAAVYRITEASVRRALDSGRSAEDLLTMLVARSRTPLPQALRYLIDDAARRHGILRAGVASTYLRCEDDALLTRVVTDRNNEPLHLLRIAPTIVISTAPVSRVLEVLRQSGYSPAAEAPDGAVIALDAEPPRAPSHAMLRPVRSRAAAESSGHFAELVRRIRAGETLSELSRRVQPIAHEIPGVTSATTMGVLREAIREGNRILLGYVDSDGNASRHTIYPISMAGGVVRGHEPGQSGLQSYALHRLTAVTVVDDEGDDST